MANSNSRSVGVFAALGGGAALIPSLIPKTSLDLTIPGFELLVAVPVMFWGLFMGVLFAPTAAARLGTNLVTKAAGLLAVCGLAFAGFGVSSISFLLGAAVFGLGFGLLEVIITAATRHKHHDSARELTRLNAAFAIAAVTAPLLLAAELAISGTILITGLVGSMVLLSSWGLGSLELSQVSGPGRARNRLSPLLLGAAFLYVGGESLLAGWGPTFLNTAEGVSVEGAPLGSTLFWGLLAIGRLVSLRVTPNYLSTKLALVLWPAVASASLVAASLLPSGYAVLGYAVASLAAGPIYGILIGQALRRVPGERVSKATRNLILMGAAGGFVIPGIVQLAPSIQVALLAAALGMALVSGAAALARDSKQLEVIA